MEVNTAEVTDLNKNYESYKKLNSFAFVLYKDCLRMRNTFYIHILVTFCGICKCQKRLQEGVLQSSCSLNC